MLIFVGFNHESDFFTKNVNASLLQMDAAVCFDSRWELIGSHEVTGDMQMSLFASSFDVVKSWRKQEHWIPCSSGSSLKRFLLGECKPTGDRYGTQQVLEKVLSHCAVVYLCRTSMVAGNPVGKQVQFMSYTGRLQNICTSVLGHVSLLENMRPSMM